jgi:RNA polymerase sigma-70 factor (ECF subfamily)
VFAIPFMELSVPPAETALDASPESLRAFYREAVPCVYGYFLHRCGGSVAVAEDLTQDTFLAALAELQKGTRVATPIAWIYGIARHKLLDHYRREERARRPLTVAWDETALEEELVVPDDSVARDRAIAALAAVVVPQRVALVLCYVDGLSVAEAGQLLGKSVEAVESLLARGRKAFKRAYLEGAT